MLYSTRRDFNRVLISHKTMFHSLADVDGVMEDIEQESSVREYKDDTNSTRSSENVPWERKCFVNNITTFHVVISFLKYLFHFIKCSPIN